MHSNVPGSFMVSSYNSIELEKLLAQVKINIDMKYRQKIDKQYAV